MGCNTNPCFSFPFLLLAFIFFCRANSVAGNEPPFTYKKGSERGPDKWGLINPEWKTCSSGKMQSPIDLPNHGLHVTPALGSLQQDYKPGPATIENRGHVIAVIWKGHGGTLSINGTVYNLVECHWHSPSEHTFKESRYDLELHMLHMSSNGEIAVVAVVYKYGQPDGFLSKFQNHISKGHGEKDLGNVDAVELSFGSKKYYRYIGSLTTPPCTEDVVWTIDEEVRTVSTEQVKLLREAVEQGFEENARPTQNLDGRTIWLYHP